MSCLRPCPGCERHINAKEPSCPFCAAEFPALEPGACADLKTTSVGRLGRAAIMAFGVTVAAGGGLSGCIVAAYGAPAPEDAGLDEDAGPREDAGPDSGAVAPAYGTPAP